MKDFDCSSEKVIQVPSSDSVYFTLSANCEVLFITILIIVLLVNGRPHQE